MAFLVNEFKQRLVNDGARPTLFDVQITFQGSTANSSVPNLNFKCKAAQIPASTVGTIEVPYFGRKIKVAGDRTFAEWTITVINDESFRIRNGFESWSNLINQHVENNRAGLYQADAVVQQYGKDGNPIVNGLYSFKNIWPSEIGAIDLSWETTDSIEEYTVTLQYDYWTNNYSTDVA